MSPAVAVAGCCKAAMCVSFSSAGGCRQLQPLQGVQEHGHRPVVRHAVTVVQDLSPALLYHPGWSPVATSVNAPLAADLDR
jgi:hypothetical protein